MRDAPFRELAKLLTWGLEIDDFEVVGETIFRKSGSDE